MVPRFIKIFPLILAFAVALPIAAYAAGIANQMGSRFDRTLSFFNTHTLETLDVKYWTDGRYDMEEMEKINHMLRDHRSGHSHEMSGELMNVLFTMKKEIQRRHPGLPVNFHIISGFRSAETNEMLRASGGGQAKKSQHIEGKAIDIRVPGVDTAELRDIAWCLQRGGVGYYKDSDFVHVDVAKVRFWNWKPKAGMCNNHGNS